MQVYLQTKNKYKEISLNPIIYAIGYYVEYKNGKHYLGSGILTVKDLLEIVDSYLANNEVDYEFISKQQKRKMVRRIFEVIKNE